MRRKVGLLVVSVAALVALAAFAAGAGANHSAKDHISLGPSGGNGVAEAFFDATSADGSRAFFDTDEQLVAGDTDASFDLYERRGGTTTGSRPGPPGGTEPSTSSSPRYPPTARGPSSRPTSS